MKVRSESWASWAMGAVFGIAAGLTTLVFGAPLMLLTGAGLALAFVATSDLRSGLWPGAGEPLSAARRDR